MNAKQKRLIAEGAALTEEIKRMNTRMKEIKATLGDLDDGRYAAPGFELLVSTAPRSSLDTAKVKGMLTPMQIVQATEINEVTTWKFRAKPVLTAVPTATKRTQTLEAVAA